MDTNKDKTATNQIEQVFDTVHEEHDPKIDANPSALAEALLANKPKPLSKNMFKLYGILVVGYMIATMNGFGGFENLL